MLSSMLPSKLSRGLRNLRGSLHSFGGLRAFRERKKIIGVKTVSNSLDVLMPVMFGYNHFNCMSTCIYIEFPFVALNFSDRLIDGLFPLCSIRVLSSDVPNSLVRVRSVGFVDALNARTLGHFGPFPDAGPA